ncbi:hypothetical protein POM88_021543 [Heracleum sosnowskyi]|uniref:Uncharacterized protein n=1 Tax=Heracleum sosnowskyi TaxID=360622 RepID=A0AAD8MTX3_9APIA|nr:hypothetical protein POM88_021543 [Heracleum sosnowskyi]
MYLCFDVFEICVNGFLWCIESYGMRMALDLNKEVFTCGVQIPEKSSKSFNNRITDFNDCIDVITNNHKENKRNSIFNLWMLDGEACLRGAGVEATWTLRLTIDVDFSFLLIFG